MNASMAGTSKLNTAMQSHLLIIATVAFVALTAILGPAKALRAILGIAATLSAAWIVSAIFTA